MWNAKMGRMCLKIPDPEMSMSLSSSPVFIKGPDDQRIGCISWDSNANDVINATSIMTLEGSVVAAHPSVTTTIPSEDESCIDNDYIANMIAVDDQGDLEEPETDRMCALWQLVEDDDVAQLRMLLKKSPDLVHWEDWSGRTVLHFAAEVGKQFCLKLLLKSGADPEALDHLGHLPLHIAADAGRHNATETLLKASQKGIDTKSWCLGWTPMHHAVFDGSILVIKVLLNFGADINIRDHMKRTPLALAKKYRPDSERLIQLLRGKGGRG